MIFVSAAGLSGSFCARGVRVRPPEMARLAARGRSGFADPACECVTIYAD